MVRHFWLFPMALMIAIACSPAANQSPASTSSNSPTSSSPQATTATAQQPTSTPAAPSFLNLINGSKQASYKVVYKISGSSAGQAMSGEQTWYAKPPKSRMDFTAATTEGSGAASMYLLEDGAYMCSATGGQKTCFKTPQQQAMQQNQGAQVQGQVQSQPDSFDTTNSGTRQIAGQQGPVLHRQAQGWDPSRIHREYYLLQHPGCSIADTEQGSRL